MLILGMAPRNWAFQFARSCSSGERSATGRKSHFRSCTGAYTVALGVLFKLPEMGTLDIAPIAPGAKLGGKYVLFDSATLIDGPADFSGWTINGLKGAQLSYNSAKTQVVLRTSRGTMLILK